jgi:hypothetical protein
MSHPLFRRSTTPAWITLVLVVVDHVRRAGGWWREVDFFWRTLKQRNEVLDAIISPYGQVALIVISVIWLFVMSRPREERGLPPVPPAAGSVGGEDGKTEIAPHPATKTATAVEPPSDERIVVDVTPEYLASFFEQHTTIQANKLVEAYLGTWMPVAGPLGDVYPNQVTFAHKTFGVVVFMYFDMTKWRDRLIVLPPGRHIKVLGQVESVNKVEVHLKNCELISS